MVNEFMPMSKIATTFEGKWLTGQNMEWGKSMHIKRIY